MAIFNSYVKLPEGKSNPNFVQIKSLSKSKLSESLSTDLDLTLWVFVQS